MKRLLLSFFLLCLTFTVFSQEGTIQGIITDDNGISIPGASVAISELRKGAISNFDGEFTILEVPAGTHTLSVRYLGYEEIDQEVNVSPGATVVARIVLKTSSMQLQEVVIEGFGIGSQARALNTQKNNLNITNVVSTDQIGKFPDANIGDAVRRIPGITMQVDQGESRNIIVRGLAPQLNSVTLNGSRIPSAEGDNRNIQMDLIPSDMIQTIEVNKSVTPDMEADALGGSVNLVTRTSPRGFRLSATAGSGINFITNKRILNGNLILGDRTKDDKFGWMVSASFNDNDFGSDNVEAEWEDEFKFTTGEDDEGEPIIEEESVNPYPGVFEMRKYLVQRIRRSFAANLDFKVDPSNTFYFKSIYNWRDDRESRFRLEHEILDGEDIEVGDFSISSNGTLTRFPIEAKRQTKGGIDNDRSQNRRLEDQRMQNYSLGGDHLFGNLKLNWMASYAKASEERLNERYLEYESEYGILYNNNEDKPLFTPVDAEAASFQDFELGELTEENQYTEEVDVNFFVNAQLPVTIVPNQEGFLKFGGLTRLKEKFRNNDFMEYSPLTGELDLLGGIPFRDYTDSNFLAGSQYQIGSFGDPEYLGNLNLMDSELFEGEDVPDEYLTENFNVRENVFAGYVMINQELTDNFSVLAGVRLEHTEIQSLGNELVFDSEGEIVGVQETRDQNDYTNILPGIHLKYDVAPNTVLRLAWSNTLARPNYVDLVPFRQINNEDEEIVLGNSELDPTTSMNFDLMAEHYFPSVGILSGGVFYKSISDFIYIFQSENEDGFEVFQPFNGDDANVYGAEVSLQRQLDFLPGFARNFSIYLNYTYLTSDTSGIRNEDGEERTDLDLPQTSPNMFNGSLAYNAKRFSIRVSANFSDAYIDEIGGRPFEDRYYDQQFFLDVNANFALTPNLSVYANLTNITDQPLRYYQGTESRTMQMEFYEKRLIFGLKYDLFGRNE